MMIMIVVMMMTLTPGRVSVVDQFSVSNVVNLVAAESSLGLIVNLQVFTPEMLPLGLNIRSGIVRWMGKRY